MLLSEEPKIVFLVARDSTKTNYRIVRYLCKLLLS